MLVEDYEQLNKPKTSGASYYDKLLAKIKEGTKYVSKFMPEEVEEEEVEKEEKTSGEMYYDELMKREELETEEPKTSGESYYNKLLNKTDDAGNEHVTSGESYYNTLASNYKDTHAPKYPKNERYVPEPVTTQNKQIMGFDTVLPSDKIMAQQQEEQNVLDLQAKENKATAKDRLKQIDDEMKVIRNKPDTMSVENRKAYGDLATERLQVQATSKPFLRGVFDAATKMPDSLLGIKGTQDLATRGVDLTEEQKQNLSTSETKLKKSVPYNVGKIGTTFATTAAQYSTVNNFLAGTKIGDILVGALGSKFGATQAVDYIADRIVQAPEEWLPLIKGEKGLKDTFKTIFYDSAIDIAMNLVVGAKGGYDEFLANKKLSQIYEAKASLKSVSATDMKSLDASNVAKTEIDLPNRGDKFIGEKVGYGKPKPFNPKTIEYDGEYFNITAKSGRNYEAINTTTGEKTLIPEIIVNSSESVKRADKILKIEDRNFEDLGKRSSKSIQTEVPETKPFYQKRAKELLEETRNAIKGKKIFIKDDMGYIVDVKGQKRGVSKDVADMLDNISGKYKDVEKGLQNIIDGKPDYAVSKRIELIIDDNLRKGYLIDGFKIEPNKQYLDIMNDIEAPKPKLKTVETEVPNENGLYRYYLKERPPSPGAQPRGQKNIVSFDDRKFIDEAKSEAWGYVEYDKPLSAKDISEYELAKTIQTSKNGKVELPEFFDDKKNMFTLEDDIYNGMEKNIDNYKKTYSQKLKEEFDDKNVIKILSDSDTDSQYVIIHKNIHKDGKELKYQVTLFDKKGAVSDARYKNLDEVTEKLVESKFKDINKMEFETKPKVELPKVKSKVKVKPKKIDAESLLKKDVAKAVSISETPKVIPADITTGKTTKFELPKVKAKAKVKVKTLPKVKAKVKVEPKIDTVPKVKVETKVEPKIDKVVKQSELRNKKERVYQELVSTNIATEKIGGKAKVLAANYNRIGGQVEYNVLHKQVGMKGEEVGKSISEIFGDTDIPNKAIFDYSLHKHSIDRIKQGKPIFDNSVTSKVNLEKMKELEAKYPKIAEKNKEVTGYYKNLLHEYGVKGGLVSKDLEKVLNDVYSNYVTVARKVDAVNILGKDSNMVSQVVKRAKGGANEILDLDQVMITQTNKFVKNAKRNELMNELADRFAKNDEKAMYYIKGVTESNVGKVKEVSDIGKILDDVSIKGDLYTVNFYKDGKPMQMVVNKTLYKSLEKATYGEIPDEVARIVKKYFANPFKELITGKNPLFAGSNIMRDIPTALSYSDNPLKMVGNVPEATKQMLTNGKLYKLFKSLGGTREGLIHSGKEFKIPKLSDSDTILKQANKLNLVKKVGDINEFGETLPRFSEFLTVYKETGDAALAIYKSAELTTDFARHGNLTKYLDSYIPYLNPAVQGIDKFGRSIVKEPLKTATKAGMAITVPTIILDQINKDDEDYNNLTPRERNLYFNIPYYDKDKNKKFVRIPKSRELGVAFSSIYEFAARKARGEEVTGEEIVQTIKENFTVANAPIWTPLFKAIGQIKEPNAYETNYWGGLIVPTKARSYSPGNQYDINSSGYAKAIGKQFNLSPYVVDYLIDSYSGIIGQIAHPLTREKQTSLLAPLSKKFINDPVYKSNSINKFYEVMAKAKEEAKDYNLENNIPSKTITNLEKKANAMSKVSRELSKIRAEQRELQVVKGKEKRVRELQKLMNKMTSEAIK